MGRRKSAKTGGAAYIASQSHEKDESHHARVKEDEEDYLELEESKRSGESDHDEEDDEEIFDLAQGESSDNSDSDETSSRGSESEGGSGEGSDEDNSEISDEENTGASANAEDLRTLVDNLPANLRQKVLMGKTNFDSEDDDSESEHEGDTEQGDEELHGASWGKKKSYYTGDTADLEIGQDIEDAIEEEEAALSLQKQRLQGMRESDFVDDVEDDADSDDEDVNKDQEYAANKDKSRSGSLSKRESVKRPFMHSLESVTLDQSRMDVSDIARDKSNMTKRQRLEMLASELPELIGLSRELLIVVTDAFREVLNLNEFLSKADYGSTPSEKLFLLYLGTKITLYHSYSTNVLFAMYLRAAGKNLRAHPVMKQILEHQYSIRNLSRVDRFYREEFRDLLSIMNSCGHDESIDKANGLLRERHAQVEGGSSAGEEKGSDSDSDEEMDSGMNAPREDDNILNVDSDGDITDDDEAFNQLEGAVKQLKRARKDSHGIGRARAPQSADFGEYDEADDKLGLHESKKHAITPSLKSSLQGFVQAHSKMTKSAHGFDDDLGDLGRSAKTAAAVHRDSDDSDDDSDDMESIISKDDNEDGNHTKAGQMDFDALRDLLKGVDPSNTGKRERRKAPDERMDRDAGDDPTLGHGTENEEDSQNSADGDDSNLYEAFTAAKQRYMAKKKLHYTVAPRYGGVEQKVEEGAKRGASYEIMKNKGLTPHRKKANRNPRVKKRHMYAKAVIARKGQIREVITPSSASYGGEATGIKANLSKGRKIKT